MFDIFRLARISHLSFECSTHISTSSSQKTFLCAGEMMIIHYLYLRRSALLHEREDSKRENEDCSMVTKQYYKASEH